MQDHRDVAWTREVGGQNSTPPLPRHDATSLQLSRLHMRRCPSGSPPKHQRSVQATGRPPSAMAACRNVLCPGLPLIIVDVLAPSTPPLRFGVGPSALDRAARVAD